MKAASVVLDRDEYQELTSYERLLDKSEELLKLCYEQNINVVVFPALLGCLFNNSESYVSDILGMSHSYKGMAICPGSFYETDSGYKYHTSCIIMDGNIILKQRQIYLAGWEKELGLCRGIELKSIPLGGMTLGIIVSTDLYYPQVSRAFAMSGADLVLAPVAIKGKASVPRQFAGLWQNVQANLFFGVESGFKGCFNGYEFHSASMIHAPLDMTENEDGILAGEENGRGGYIIVAELDNNKRKKAVSRFNTLAQLNREAYKDIFQPSGCGGYHG